MMKWYKRTLALFLSFLLIISAAPLNVMAGEETDSFASQEGDGSEELSTSDSQEDQNLVTQSPGMDSDSQTETQDPDADSDSQTELQAPDADAGSQTEPQIQNAVLSSQTEPQIQNTVPDSQAEPQIQNADPASQPEAPNETTSIWGKGGENWKLHIISTCTNPNAAHKGDNPKTDKKNFISGKYFTFGEMTLNGETWEVSAAFNAALYLEETFKEPHTAADVTVPLEYVNNKWCVKSEEDIAVIRLEGACEDQGPDAPVLGENLEVWVQMYAGEYDPVKGSQIDRYPTTYGPSVSFGEVEKDGDQWICNMTVIGYTEDSDLADHCYLNVNMNTSKYELDSYTDGVETVKLTYNQTTGKWECPAISLKHTSRGPGETDPEVRYGVSFKIKDKEAGTEAPALPVENPVHNGGFWVSLYEYDSDGKAVEVYTQVYDGTQDYVQFSDPVEGGILDTFTTTATVNGQDVLEASGLEGYQLDDSYATKENDLIFDWNSMTWTAETMRPQFDQPDSTIAKRGLAFRVEQTEEIPELPNTDNCKDFYVTVYGEEDYNGDAVNKNLRSYKWDLAGDYADITFGKPVKNSEGEWTCTATVDAEAFVNSMLEEYQSSHYRKDETDPTTKEVTLTYNERTSKWKAESDGVIYGYPSNPTTKNGVAFRLIKQYEVTYGPGRDLSLKIPEGEKYSGGIFDKGAQVDLPDTADFVPYEGVFAGWKVLLKSGSNSTLYFYPIGTDMTMFGKDVEVEAYWMDVELDVASIPYDSELTVKDYTFGDTAEVTVNDGESVTLLYRANVRGNSQYPYTLSCDGAAAVYGSELEGAIDKYQTSEYVYFTKTYTPDASSQLTETVSMGDAQDTAQADFTVKPVSYTVTFNANGGTGTMDPATVEAGGSYTLPECGFTAPEGKQFKAWNVNGEELAAGDTITVNGDVEITAVWEEEIPETPDNTNCTDFYVTVYGEETKNDDSVVNHVLRSLRWDLVDEDEVQIAFGQPVKNSEGIWTCTATVTAETFVNEVLKDHTSSHYRKDENDPTTKEVTLTYNEKTSKWKAESDGVTYGYPSKPTTKNGVAFRLIKQYEVTYVPGRDLSFGTPEGEEYSGGVFDKGAQVDLPDIADFVPNEGVFAGWKVSIKSGTNSTVYFYPIGTDMTMFGQDVEVEAYWMDVELDVASIPYDSELTVKDYTFGDTAEVTVNDGESVTLLYRANVRGNSQYPYTLSCDGAAAVYGSELEGAIDKYQTSEYVYFTKTYTPDASSQLTETVSMGNAQDTAQAAFTVKPVSYTVTFDANGGTGTMDPITVEEGEGYTLPECGFTAPEGKQFKAWSVDGRELAAGETITVNGNVKITAVWENVSSSDTPKTDTPKTDTSKTDTPKTGDFSNFSLWGTIMGTSVLLAAIILMQYKRRYR